MYCLLPGCISQPLSAAELVSIENVTLIDAGLNDGDSFKVNADGRELHLRLYYVDCPETTFNSKPVLERIREQQRHFGLEDPHDVVRYGELAAEYVKEVLSQPFTIYTSYAQAPGRSALVRYYAFVETHDGHDLGHLLIEQGFGQDTRQRPVPSPDGAPSHTVLRRAPGPAHHRPVEPRRDLAVIPTRVSWPKCANASGRRLKNSGIIPSKVWRRVRTRDDQPLNLNSATEGGATSKSLGSARLRRSRSPTGGRMSLLMIC